MIPHRHRPTLKQIATEDPELLCHTEAMKRADLETLKTFDRLRQWIEPLPDIAEKIEPAVGTGINTHPDFARRVREVFGNQIRSGQLSNGHLQKLSV